MRAYALGLLLGYGLDVRIKHVPARKIYNILDGVLDLAIFCLDRALLRAHVELLLEDELVQRQRLLLGQVDEERLRDRLEVLLDAVLA